MPFWSSKRQGFDAKDLKPELLLAHFSSLGNQSYQASMPTAALRCTVNLPHEAPLADFAVGLFCGQWLNSFCSGLSKILNATRQSLNYWDSSIGHRAASPYIAIHGFSCDSASFSLQELSIPGCSGSAWVTLIILPQAPSPLFHTSIQTW